MRSACESALAEAYLRVLGHVEAEAHWLGTYVYNFGLNHDILQYGAVQVKTVAKPEDADRTATAALIAGFGSKTVRSVYEKWCEATDAFSARIEFIEVGASLRPHSSSGAVTSMSLRIRWACASPKNTPCGCRELRQVMRQ